MQNEIKTATDASKKRRATRDTSQTTGSTPVIKWSRMVTAKTEPAGNFNKVVRVMSEFAARQTVIEALAMYGIHPETKE